MTGEVFGLWEEEVLNKELYIFKDCIGRTHLASSDEKELIGSLIQDGYSVDEVKVYSSGSNEMRRLIYCRNMLKKEIRDKSKVLTAEEMAKKLDIPLDLNESWI